MGPTKKPILVAAFVNPGDNLRDQSLLPEYRQILGLGSDGPATVGYAALENGQRRVYSPGPSLSSFSVEYCEFLKDRTRSNAR